jgi:hypothetical protein
MAPRIFKKGDAQWLYDASCLLPAAKLDPERGIGWLKKAMEKPYASRCLLLDALWSIAGEEQLPYIKDRYFEDARDSRTIQRHFVKELCRTQGEKAAPLLKALILDRRFTTLEWPVEHRMGEQRFMDHPQERDKYLVDTKHVLMQTEAFQTYLQEEVLKRSQKNEGQ